MAKRSKSRRGLVAGKSKPIPYALRSRSLKISKKEVKQAVKCCKPSVKKDWEDAVCPICMECPHNAVLLLCSSHEKGCRTYMCDTECQLSNCLVQYKKASSRIADLSCPLCRGEVRGWTVVESARKFLDAQKRSCTQDNCSFSGAYKELKKHVEAVHPLARPREVDPVLEQEWRRMEHERERNDVISTIRSSTPGAIVMGDYVIESGSVDPAGSVPNEGVNSSVRDIMNFLFMIQDFEESRGTTLNARLRRLQRDTHHNNERASRQSNESLPAEDAGAVSTNPGGESTTRGGRILLGRSGRRQRRRESRQVR